MRKTNGQKWIMIAVLTGFMSFGWFFIPVSTQAQSSTPTPAATPSQQAQVTMTMADSLRSMTGEAIATRQAFIQNVERPMFGWLFVIAQMLAMIMFSWAIVQGMLVNGGFTAGDIYRITMRAAVGFLLLFFSGDVDGDGVKGDLLNYPASVGYYYAYGINAMGKQEDAYLARTVRQQSKEFDTTYRKFVENKLMVKVKDVDLPVSYPTAKDVNLLSALYIGKFDNQDDFDKAKSRAWQMSILYGILDFNRGLMSFADLFLFLMQGFAVICLRLALPLMIGMMFYKEFGQKMTIGYFWTAFVFCIVFPGMTQFIRLCFYGAGRAALGVGGDNPYYQFDPGSGKIIANGNPEAVVIIASIYMGFSALTMFASFFLSLYLSQGKILEGVVSTFSGWFTAAASIGMGVGTGAVASRMNLEADKTQQVGAQESAMVEAGFSKQAAEAGAEGSNRASKVLADSRSDASVRQGEYGYVGDMIRTDAAYRSAQTSAFSGLVGSYSSVNAEKFSSVQSAGMNLKQDWATLSAEQRKERAMNILEEAKSNNDAQAKELIEMVKQRPEMLELGGKTFEEAVNSVPVFGQIAKTAGFNGDAANFWFRSRADNAANGHGDLLNDSNNSINQAQKGLQYNPQQSGDSAPAVVSSGSGGRTSLPAPTATQKNNMANFGKLVKSDPEFLPALQTMAKRNKWDADGLVNLMALETAGSFNKSIRGGGNNSKTGVKQDYVGLIQFGQDARTDLNRKFGTPTDVGGFQNHLKSIPASQQLKYVESYLKDKQRISGTSLDSTSKLYAAVGAGSASTNDNIVMFRQGGYQGGDFGNTRRISSAGYKGNAPWDFNKDGKIQQYEFGKAAESKLGAGQHFTVAGAMNEIAVASPAVAKIIASKRAAQLETQFSIQNNRMMAEGKQNANNQFYSEKFGAARMKYDETVGIANQSAAIKYKGADDSYALNLQAANINRVAGVQEAGTKLQGVRDVAKMTKAGEYSAADINMQTAYKQANLAYEGRRLATQITYDSAMKASTTRAMAQMVQNIGSTAGQRFADAGEKFNRL